MQKRYYRLRVQEKYLKRQSQKVISEYLGFADL